VSTYVVVEFRKDHIFKTVVFSLFIFANSLDVKLNILTRN